MTLLLSDLLGSFKWFSAFIKLLAGTVYLVPTLTVRTISFQSQIMLLLALKAIGGSLALVGTCLII